MDDRALDRSALVYSGWSFPLMVDEAFIMDRCIPEPNSGCWLWLYSLQNKGYGVVWDGKKRWLAHRLSFYVRYGHVGDKILHRCDIPCCVNPDHLFSGTQSDNIRDCVEKGRHKSPLLCTKGSSHHNAVLTEEDIPKIRADNRCYREIGHEYGITKTNVMNIKKRRTWRHVP